MIWSPNGAKVFGISGPNAPNVKPSKMYRPTIYQTMCVSKLLLVRKDFMKAICPNDPRPGEETREPKTPAGPHFDQDHKCFVVAVTSREDWIVDSTGALLERNDNNFEVVSGPKRHQVWICRTCDERATVS